MPNNMEGLSLDANNAGELNAENLRTAYQDRGRKTGETITNQAERKSLREMSLIELLNTSKDQLREYSIEELIEARERLRSEYKKRTGKEVPSPNTSTASPETEAVPTVEESPASVVESAVAAAPATQSSEIEELTAFDIDDIDEPNIPEPETAETVETAEITETPETPETSEAATQNLELQSVEAEEREKISAEEIEKLATEAVRQGLAEAVGQENAAAAEQMVPAVETARIPIETARATYEKSRSKHNIKQILTKKVLPVVLSALLVIPGIAALVNKSNEVITNDSTTPPASPVEQPFNSYDDYVAATGGGNVNGEDQDIDSGINISETQEIKTGIQDGYDKAGMFLSPNKGTPYDFANAGEVGDALNDHDPRSILLEVDRNQVESFADHLAGIPDNIKDQYGLSEFNGLSILETEQKLESLDNGTYDQIFNKYEKAINSAFTREVELNGDYDNAYMQQTAEDAIHQNIILVRCTTHEDGTKATEFYWTDDGTFDGNDVGTMISKMVENGGCTQIVRVIGSPAFKDMQTVIDLQAPPVIPPSHPETPPEPTPPEPTPPEPTPPEPTPPEPTPPEPTPPEPTPPEPTPPEPTPPEPTPPEPTPPEEIAPKDPENLTRIDDQINEDIAEDIGTDEVVVTPTEEVSPEDITEQPTAEDFQGTEPEIVQNETSEQAAPVQEVVSEANDYEENQGGANAEEYAPVQADESAQAAADAAETPVEEAPTGGEEVEEELNDLGIN